MNSRISADIELPPLTSPLTDSGNAVGHGKSGTFVDLIDSSTNDGLSETGARETLLLPMLKCCAVTADVAEAPHDQYVTLLSLDGSLPAHCARDT